MRTQNPLVATPCGFKSHRRHHVGMDYAPFKKPSHSAGLFSYRSVIPPFPHKTLLCKLSWGPRPTGQGGEQASISSRKRTSEWTVLHSKSPAVWLGFSHTAPSFLLLPTKLCCANFCGDPAALPGGKRKLCIACGGFFCKIVARSFCCSISAQEPPHMRRLASKRARGRSRFARKSRCAGFPRDPAALPGGNALRSIQKAQPFDWAFLIPLRHSSFSPQNFAAQTFAGPRRPVLHSKRPSLRPGVSCAAGAKSSNPETLAPLSEHFPAPSPYFCPACRRKLWHYSQLRTHVFVWYDDPRNIKQERNLKICLRTNGKA